MTANISVGWEQLLQQGKQASSQQDFGRAEVLFNNALEQAFAQSAPEAASGEIFFHLGWCLEAQGRIQDAIKRYKQSLGSLERSHGPDAESTNTVRTRLQTMMEALAAQQAAGNATNSRAAAPTTDRRDAEQTADQRDAAYESHPQSAPSQARLPTKSKKQAAQRQAPSTPKDPTYEEVISRVELNRGNMRLEDFIHPREKNYGLISSAIGVITYGLSVLCLVGLVIAPLALLGSFISGGIHLGALRSRGIKVSDRQFPEVYALIEQFCSQMKMEIPDVFVIQDHGLLNAFAQRLHRKDMIVISADVLELAYEFGQNELAFVICHELSHVKLGHVKQAWLHIPGGMVPFLGSAYSRACEYSCDRIAQHYAPEGALYGLVALAAGTKLYREVNLKAMYDDADASWGFWTWYHEIQSTHPNLVNRIRSIGMSEEVAKDFAQNAHRSKADRS